MIIEIPQGSDQKLTYQHDYSVSKTTVSRIFYFFFIENWNLLIDQLLSIRNNRTLQARFGSQKGKKIIQIVLTKKNNYIFWF